MGPEVIDLVRDEDWSRADALDLWPLGVIADGSVGRARFSSDGFGGDGFGGDGFCGDGFCGDGFCGDEFCGGGFGVVGFGTGEMDALDSLGDDVRELVGGPFSKRLSIFSKQLPTSV